MTCAKCKERLLLVELRCVRRHSGVRSVTARYRCPNSCVVALIADHVPASAVLWRFYLSERRGSKWHLWIEELEAPTRARVDDASVCGLADAVAHPDRIAEDPETRERVCQMCRRFARKFEIKLPKGARR